MAGMGSAADGNRLVGEPVTVIRVNEQGKLTLDSEALRSVLLQKDVRDLPVVVLLVAGAFRTGKSSILNVLLRFPFLQFEDWLGEPDKPLGGFPWMPGCDAHTEGIVFCSHLIKATTADKKKVAVLLVDTQGSFGTSSSTAESVHICALSVLISSIQVFNVMRNLQFDHLQHLQTYYEYAKQVQGLVGGASSFQLCVLLVRDWPWPKQHEFGWEGGEQLLQKILAVESKNKATDELRALRNYFRSCVSSRKCFLMPPPGQTDDGFSINGAVNGITPSFNEYLRDFVWGVLSPSELVVKTVAGKPVTASELCRFVEKMIPMFSSEKLPAPGIMVGKTAEFISELAREKALMEYRYSLGQVLLSAEKFISPEELIQKVQSICIEVLDSFDNAPCLTLYEYNKRERESFIEALDTIFKEVWTEYMYVRKKYEEKEKLRNNFEKASTGLGGIATAATLCAAIVPMAVNPMGMMTAAGVFKVFTSTAATLTGIAAAGTKATAALINQKNEKDSAEEARNIAADLVKKNEQSLAG